MPVCLCCQQLAMPAFTSLIGPGDQANAQIPGEVDFPTIDKSFSIGNADIELAVNDTFHPIPAIG